MENLIQTVRIYSQDIEMEFGREKCTMLVVMKNSKQHITEGVELPNQVIIRMLREKKKQQQILANIGS